MAERELSESEKQGVIEGIVAIEEKAAREPVPEISRNQPRFHVIRMNLKLFEGETRQIKHLTVRAGEALKAHWTSRPLLIFAVAGQCVWEGAGESVPLKPGEGVLNACPPDPHPEDRNRCPPAPGLPRPM